MDFTNNLLSITSHPYILLLLVVAAMYFARKPAHRAIKSFSRVINNAMRLSSASFLLAEEKLTQRNREVLMAEGLENAERMVEREFDRIKAAVARDLEGYPALQRKISEVIVQVEEDYNSSVDVPTALPDWVKVIEAIANIEDTGDSMVSNMLGEINRTLRDRHKETIASYRDASSKRHAILNRMMPMWRKVQRVLDDVGKSVEDLTRRAKTIDRYMDEYESIRAKSDKAARKLSSSSMTQFFISGLVLLVAVGGAMINFNLIALPMSEMVGGGSYIGPYKTSDVAGLVIILVELSMGLFLLESLRITRLFPVIGSMDDKMRIRMIWITLTLLTVLAGVESALAFMRDRIAADMEALRQTLAGVQDSGLATSIIPTIGQMVMGFILPFALAFVAIPLESFISSARTVLGVTAAGGLRIIAFLLRLVGAISYYIGQSIIGIYDLLIFPPLWLEGIIAGTPFKLKDSFTRSKKAKKLKKAMPMESFSEDQTQIMGS